MDTMILVDVSKGGQGGPSIVLHKIEVIADIKNSTVGGEGNNTQIFMDSGAKALSPLTHHQLLERITQAALKAAGVDARSADERLADLFPERGDSE